MARPRNELGGFFDKKNALKPDKINGHEFGWWVRQLRKFSIAFQKSKRFNNFCIHANPNTVNEAMVEAVYACAGYRASQEFSGTLYWQ